MFILALLFFSAVSFAQTGGDLSHQRVLLLYSYHPNFPTSSKVAKGLEAAFDGNVPVIEKEFLDSKRSWDHITQEVVFKSLSYRLQRRAPYQVVIVADDNALNFALKYKPLLFADTPIVFLGINDIANATKSAKRDDVTGVVEAASFKETIQLSKSLLPQRNSGIIIVDGSTSGQADLRSIMDILPQFVGMTFETLSLNELSWNQLSVDLKALNNRDVIFLVSAYRDKYNQEKSFDESLELISQSTTVPIMHFWEHGISKGILGGVVVSHFEQGYQAGLMAKRILLGDSASDIPLMLSSPNVAMFDYQELESQALLEQALPEQAVIINKPRSLLDEYKNEISLLGLSFAFLTLFAIYLIRKNHQMRVLSRKLSEQSDFLRLLMNTSPDLVWIKSPEGVYLACNRRFQSLFNASEQEIIGATDYKFVERALADQFKFDDQAALNHVGPIVVEEALTFAEDGHTELLETIKTAIFDSSTGNLLGVLGVARDITQRKANEVAISQSEKKYRVLFEEITQGVIVYNTKNQVIDVNPAAVRILGRERDVILGSVLPPELWLKDSEIVGNGAGKGLIECSLADNTLKKGVLIHGMSPNSQHMKWLVVDIVPVLGHDDTMENRIFVSFNDITEQKNTEETLRLAASVFESSAEGVIITDSSANIVDVNHSFINITGYSKKEALGKNPRFLKSGLTPTSLYSDIWRSLTTKGVWQGELTNKRKDGSVFSVWQTISAVKDSDGGLSHYVSVFSDITQLKESQERIHYLAFHDSLTNMPNRRMLMERLELLVENFARTKQPFALVYLDLDNFKNINDTLGHSEGDRVLERVAVQLGQYHADFISRVGGDEFVLLIESTANRRMLAATVTKLLDNVCRPFESNGNTITVSASAGICTFPQDGYQATDLLKHADIAMYRAKNKGRNTYAFFDQSMSEMVVERAKIESELRLAIERDEFSLVYQPQFNVKTKQLVGAEALIRWQSTKLGFIPPDKMIPVAEESGLILSIGQWVLNEAARQTREWLDKGIDIGRIAINIAGPQIRSGNLVEEVTNALDTHSLQASHIALEITETFIMQNVDTSINQLKVLDDMGVEIAIDDFGTGYSSLSSLKRLPINKLKIDKSFIREVPEDADDVAIVKTVIALGKSLGLKVIAEGVETIEQEEFLHHEKCDELQGYLYSKPIKPQDIESLYTRLKAEI